MASPEYVCDYCSRSFTRKYNLQNHIENFHLNSTCTCDVCHQKFGTAAGYQLHMSRGHNRKGQSYPECDLCGRIFSRRQNIISHMNTVHMPSPAAGFCCQLCYKYFTTEWSLKRHMQQIHNPDYPSCSICKKIFKRQDGLDSHMQSCHRRGAHSKQCNICNKSYVNNRNLRRHIETAHTKKNDIADNGTQSWMKEYTESTTEEDDDEFTCNLCSEYFEEEKQLRQHMKTQHSFKAFYKYCRSALLKQTNKEGGNTQDTHSFVCDYCTSISNSYEDLKHHLHLKHGKDICVSTCNVCFKKFYTKDSMNNHKQICSPPSNTHQCSYCEKLFTVQSSLEFHLKIFHPETQIADSNITSTNDVQKSALLKCQYCERIYYSDKSLKHHVKLKHTTDEATKCQFCDKVCRNKYYCAMHVKLVHNNDDLLKCDYCEKHFRSKRNIRRHIEFTHLGIQRHKCIECESLFKEKRSLRKHVRAKHADSPLFPQCHVCSKRFESAKSRMIHLKLIHSVNVTAHPCHLCSVSFNSRAGLKCHLDTKHRAEEKIYKCNECSHIFKGQDSFERHHEIDHATTSYVPAKPLPRCVICAKDFSTRKTLKRHIKKFHTEFNMFELVDYPSQKRDLRVDCEECLRNFNDDRYWKIYQKNKLLSESKIFKCEQCSTSYNPLDYAIQRCKLKNSSFKQGNAIMSELCTAEMSEDGTYSESEFGKLHELMEAESTTADIKLEPPDEIISENYIKSEPTSP